MPGEPPPPETAREHGRRLACEGIMRSQFGRRSCHAVRHAVERLREEESRTIVFPEVAQAGRTRPAWVNSAMGIAAAAALFLGLGVWFFGPPMGEPALAALQGSGATLERGTETFPATVGTRLRPTDILRTGTNAIVTIMFDPEQTRFDLGAESELKLLSFHQGKRFDLRFGKLIATVARQRPFHPMLVRTPNAEARVLGTKFTLVASTDATRLDVDEGRVRLTSTTTGRHVDVIKGHYAIAAANVTLAALPKTGGILREYWTNILGDHPGQLAREPAFPDRPNGSELLKNFEVRSNWGDHFGDRIRGFIHPPVTGTYVFWVSASPNTTLTLSPTEKPEDRTQIGISDGGPPHDWDRHMVQCSGPLTLAAGRRYYIEVIRKTDTGLDHLAVAWQRPGGEREIIAAEFLSPVVARKGRR